MPECHYMRYGCRCDDQKCSVCPEQLTQGFSVLTPSYAPNPIQDAVVLPQHYARFKIEPIRFICENKLDFFQGNIVKYTCRHDAKNGVEDLKKARRYIDMYIEFLQGHHDWWASPSAAAVHEEDQG